MTVKYIDAHCHVQFDAYADDREEIIERMKTEGVVGVVVGVDNESSKNAITLAQKHEHLFASIGLHPNSVFEEEFDEKEYRALAEHPKVVAIGECGLDFFRPKEVTDAVKAKQKEILQKHIALAAAVDKPLIIHSRPSKGTQDAYQELIELLKEAKTEFGNVRGDIHFFVGSIQEANELIALGFTVSFTAVITFARDYDAVVQGVPLTNILCETDAPYLAPAGRRGTRNDPLAVIDVVAKIAELRHENLEMVRTTLVSNASKLFSISR